jgi:lipopolysaccharide export LptBFGC system permease protein LptF
MWMVKEFPREYAKGARLRGVEVTTQHADGSLESRLYAKEAQWIESNRSWSFSGVELSDHHRNQAPIFVKLPSPYTIDDWGETPAQIIKLGVDVRNLSVPDLMDLIRSDMSAEWQGRDPARYATQLHYRWAQSLSCLVYVILAVPLSLYVTRRASGSGLAVAIGLAILMVVVTTVLLALGESNNMSPVLAVWSPVALFSLVGICLMKRRISGRPLWPPFG